MAESSVLKGVCCEAAKYNTGRQDATGTQQSNRAYIPDLEGAVMDFTWCHIITLIDRLWGLNQTRIAERLGVHRSTVSRLANGVQQTLDRPHKEVYRKLFAPSLEGSIKQTRFLNEIKQELEEMGFGEIIKDLDDSSCESFVIGLLRMANENGSKGNTSQENPPSNTSTLPVIRRSANRLPKETTQPLSRVPLYERFNSAVSGFPIEKFLDSSPVDSLADYLVRDAVTFWGRINAEREQEDAPDRNTKTYQRIIIFIDALKDYLGFLMANSVRPDAFPDGFRLVSGDGEVVDKANYYRERAKDLFNSVNAAVEAERMRINQERTDAIHAGEYSPPPTLEIYRKKFKAT